MTTPLLVLSLMTLEAIWIFVAAATPGPYRLRGTVVINLLLVAIFAPKLMNVFGHTTNITSVAYASAFAAQMILIMNYGREKAYRTIEMVVFSLTMLFTLSYLIRIFPITENGIQFALAVDVLVRNMTHVVIASVTSFIIAIVAMIETYTKLLATRGKTVAFVTSLIAGQLVDSSLFFAVAFHEWSTAEQLEFIWFGFVLKVMIGLSFAPLVACATRRIFRTESRGHHV